MKLLIIILLLLILIVLIVKKKAQADLGISIPRKLPVYIDSPTLYLNEQILYSEWPQEISSSL